MDSRFRAEFRKLAVRYGVKKDYVLESHIGIVAPGGIRGTIYWFDWTDHYRFSLKHDSKPSASGNGFLPDMCRAYNFALDDLFGQAEDFYLGMVEAKRLAEAKPAVKKKWAVVESAGTTDE